MKRSFIISTIFFLCAFFLISTAAEATLTVDSVLREISYDIYEWVEYGPGEAGSELIADGYNSKRELGKFESTLSKNIEYTNVNVSQNTYIGLKDNILTLTGNGYVHSYSDYDHSTYAMSGIHIHFSIDEPYHFSLNGKITSEPNDPYLAVVALLDDCFDNDEYYEFYEYYGNTDLDKNLILPKGKYYFKLEIDTWTYPFSEDEIDGKFENINLTLEPAASAPIPQSFWLLCSGSILILLYARRQVMA